MKKLSFILAMIIALSGIVGLFAAPAYAADEEADVIAYEYTVGTGGEYATIADAMVKVNENEKKAPGEHYIAVVSDITETKAEVKFTGTVVIYGDVESDENPLITVNAGASTGWLCPTGETTLAFLGIDIDGQTSGDTIHVVNGNGNDLNFVGLGCDINNPKGRFIHIKNGAKFENCNMEWTIYGCEITTPNAATLQFNNRAPKDDENENVSLDLTIYDSYVAGKNNTVYVNAAITNVVIYESTIETLAKGNNALNLNRNNVTAQINVTCIDSEFIIAKGGGAVTGSVSGIGELNFIGCSFYGESRGFMMNNNRAEEITYNFYECDFEIGCDKYGVFYMYHGSGNNNVNIYNCQILSGATENGVFWNKAGSDGEAGYNVAIYDSMIVSLTDAPIFTQEKDFEGEIVVYNSILGNDASTKLVNGEGVYIFSGVVAARGEFDPYEINAAADVVIAESIETGEEGLFAYEISLAPEGIEFDDEETAIFKVKGVQLLNGTTADSASTVVRVLFQIKASEIDKFDNYAFWYSTEAYTGCMNLEGECYMPDVYDGSIVSESARANLAYTSVIAGGETVAADDGYLYIPLTINVSAEDFDTDLYIRAFAQNDGMNGLVVSDMIEINLAELFPALAQ